MSIEKTEFRFKGRSFVVPTCRIEGWEVIAVGRWLRIASLKDEEWLEGDPLSDPPKFFSALRASGLPADIFTFSGRLDGSPAQLLAHGSQLGMTQALPGDQPETDLLCRLGPLASIGALAFR